MCRTAKKKGCEYPDRLKEKPEECPPEQVKECHGDISIENHPCLSENRKE